MGNSRNDMLERYLQAVGFWLPRRQKQDILAELSEDLQSQIEDREEEVGHPLHEAETAALLKRRGRPILVAGKFLPQQHLIGPALFPIYVFVLKVIALCYIVPWLLVWIGFLIFDRGHAHSLGSLWTVMFTQFGIITLVFAVLDRVSTREKLFDDWDPRKLPKLRPQQATKRRSEAVCGIIFGIFGLGWLLAVPNYPFLILGPLAYVLKPAPIWETVYMPIILLSIAGIFEHVVTLLRPQLGWFRPTFRIATTAFSLWIARVLLESRDYIIATNSHAAQVAAVANLSILICVACTAFGLVIGLFIYGWQAIQELRRSLRPATASLA